MLQDLQSGVAISDAELDDEIRRASLVEPLELPLHAGEALTATATLTQATATLIISLTATFTPTFTRRGPRTACQR